MAPEKSGLNTTSRPDVTHLNPTIRERQLQDAMTIRRPTAIPVPAEDHLTKIITDDPVTAIMSGRRNSIRPIPNRRSSISRRSLTDLRIMP